MKVIWLVGPLAAGHVSGQNPEASLLACPLASARLRLGVAADAWRREGNENRFVEPASPNAREAIERGAQICVMPKFSIDLPLAPWIAACRAAKDSGARLLVDVCDYPFRPKPDVVDEFYKLALGMADALVVNSVRMAEQMAPHFARTPVVIADAVLDPMAKPAFGPAKRLNLLWFGHPSNLRFLEPCINELIASAPRPCRLVIVTQDGHGAREAAQQLQARFGPDFETRFVEWSLQATRRELAACDLALLPGVPDDAKKSAVSANRLAEILNAGRFPVASPMHSYLEFENGAWLGDNLMEGIRWAQANPAAVLERIARGQTLVAEKYAKEKLGNQWCKVLKEVACAP